MKTLKRLWRRRATKALCTGLPIALLLTACNTGFNPGMTAGGRCFWSPAGPSTTNYFHYTADCVGLDNSDVGGRNPWGPDHYFMVVFKDGGDGSLNSLQAAPIGLTDNTVKPAVNTSHQDSHFQMTLNNDGAGFDTRMNLKSGATDPTGQHIDFDLGNTATDGVQDGNQTLYSHHELKMDSESGTTEMSYIIRFSVGGQNYALQYALRPQQNGHLAGAPACIDYYSDESAWEHYITLDSTCFGAPNFNDHHWHAVDINWAYLVNWIKGTSYFASQHYWQDIYLPGTHGQPVNEQFYETVYGPRNSALGGIDATNRNWVMNYH
jgi:hypothetical protein